MIRISTFERWHPGVVDPAEVRRMDNSGALQELVSYLCWNTKVERADCRHVLIKCPDFRPVGFVLFEEETDRGANNAPQSVGGCFDLMNVAVWYAEATGLCSSDLGAVLAPDILKRREAPLEGIPSEAFATA